jgi:hypothetical protein
VKKTQARSTECGVIICDRMCNWPVFGSDGTVFRHGSFQRQSPNPHHRTSTNKRLRSLRLPSGTGRSSVLVVVVFMLFGDQLLRPDYRFGLDTLRRDDGTGQMELRLLFRLKPCAPENPTDQREETPACRLHIIQHSLNTIKQTHAKYRLP